MQVNTSRRPPKISSIFLYSSEQMNILTTCWW